MSSQPPNNATQATSKNSVATTKQAPPPKEAGTEESKAEVAGQNDPAQPPPQGSGDAKDAKPKPAKKRKERKGKPGKIHVKLPSIEAYQKDLCFPADAPGRVVVRLERLMGSDKIRPVDGKYMDTLIQRLEEEETMAWVKKIKQRKKDEQDRVRQLAIQGLMEPVAGMEDLYDHPVFRVNRILNRLDKDKSSTTTPPPIQEIEPFEDDQTGAYFLNYAFHRQLRQEWEKQKGPVNKDKQNQQAKPAESQEPSEDEEEDEASRASEKRPSEVDQATDVLLHDYEKSLEELQKKYNVPGESDDLEEEWKPYTSPFIEMFGDFATADQLFDGAKSIFDLYTKQQLTVKDHVKKESKVSRLKSTNDLLNAFLREYPGEGYSDESEYESGDLPDLYGGQESTDE